MSLKRNLGMISEISQSKPWLNLTLMFSDSYIKAELRNWTSFFNWSSWDSSVTVSPPVAWGIREQKKKKKLMAQANICPLSSPVWNLLWSRHPARACYIWSIVQLIKHFGSLKWVPVWMLTSLEVFINQSKKILGVEILLDLSQGHFDLKRTRNSTQELKNDLWVHSLSRLDQHLVRVNQTYVRWQRYHMFCNFLLHDC